MKKLNLLSRAEMKNVMGGYIKALCVMTNTLADGTVETPTIDVQDEAGAQAWCDSQTNATFEPSISCSFKCSGGTVS